MIGDSGGDEKHNDFDPDERDEEENAIKHRSPHQEQGNDFCPYRYGFLLPEITYVGTEILVVQEPLIEPGRTFKIERCGEQ